ncbi:MAG: MFS transporter [Pseudomonadota bacterium]
MMGQAKGADPSKSWLALAASAAGVFAVAYNTTAVMTALPAMKAGLDLDADTVQWTINIYMLFAAATLAAMGHFGDTFGMTRIFIVGLVIFGLGSVTMILADGAISALVGRALQGTGVSALMATSVALINLSVPPDKRASALGLWAATIAVGFALGPLIGGGLTDAVGWRSIFALDIVSIIAASLLIVWVIRAKLIPGSSEAGLPTDFFGIGLLFISLSAFLYGLTCGPLYGWTALLTLSMFTLAVIAAAGFAYRELHTKDPLIRFGFFRYRNYAAATVGMFLSGITQIGILFFINFFLQAPQGLNFSAAEAGLGLLPFTSAMFVVSLSAPRLIHPGHYKWPLALGMASLAIGFWLMLGVDHTTPYEDIWWKLSLIGIGVGMNMSMLPRIGLAALPDANAGQGSGVLNTCMYAGLAVGTALGGVVSFRLKRDVIDPVLETVAANVPDLGALKIALVHGSKSQIEQAMTKIPASGAEALEKASLSAFDHSFSGVMTLMMITALISVVFCVIAIEPPKTEPQAKHA